MVILRTEMGNEVLTLLPMAEPLRPIEEQETPFTFCICVVQYQQDYLFAYNAERAQWEIAGGGIEAGESLVDCVKREILEEISQVVETVTCHGIFKLRLMPDDRLEYAAIYSAKIDELRPFQVNAETNQLALCRHPDELQGKVSELSRMAWDFVMQG